MSGKVQHRHQRPTAAAKRRQALLVRAVVGSLVLCAAFAPNALAQEKHHDNQVQLAHNQQFRELLAEVRKLVRPGDFDLDKTIEITVDAEAIGNTEDDPLHHFEVISAPGTDPFWSEVVSRAVITLRGSGAHRVLKDAKRISMRLRLDGQHATANVVATFDAENRASQLTEKFSGLLRLARLSSRNPDEALVLNNMAFSANGKRLAMQLEMMREQAGNLLRKYVSLP